MIRALIEGSVRNAPAVVLLALLVAGFAAFTARRMDVDVFPELNAPVVVVLTEAGGLSSMDVERTVTMPIEAVVGGLPGVRRTRSGSALSLSLVYVEFDWGVDLYRARQVVGEALDVARGDLPEGVHTEIAPISGVLGEIQLLSLSSPDRSVDELELRALGEFDLRQRLLAVPGVAQVVALGGHMPEYVVEVDPLELRSRGLAMADVLDAASEAHSTLGAGYLADVRGSEVPLLQVASVRTAADLAGTLVAELDGAPVTLGDVAEVSLAAAPVRGSATQDGTPCVVVGIKKSPFANTLDVTRAVDEALDQFEPGLPEGVALDRDVFRQADFIELSLRNVVHVLRDAAIFVAIVLALFLLHARTTLITLTAIPLSVALALLVLDALGLGLDVMTLGGLAIAIGELVDDAIIDVENVLRRLRENSALPEGERRAALRVIVDASNEVRGSVVFATVIIVVVFVPLLFLEGLEGRFFRPMGTAYIAAILASLLVAVTVVPALCRLLLSRVGAKGEERASLLVRGLQAIYVPTLGACLRLRWLVLVLGLAATLGAAWVARTFGADFLPNFEEGTMLVTVNAPPGTGLPTSTALTRGLGERLAAIDGVRTAVGRTGRAERDEHAHGPETTEFMVALEPGVTPRDVEHELDELVASLPGLSVTTGAPIAHQLSTALSGTKAQIAINVFGPDLAVLREIAAELEHELEGVPGVRDLLANREARVEALPIRYRHADLARAGLTPGEAASQVQAAFDGRRIDRVQDGLRNYDIVVRLAAAARRTPADVRSFLLRGRDGALVRLDEVADVVPDAVPLGVQHENGQRKAVISLNVAEGHNLSQTVAAVDAVATPIVREHGYSVSYGGQFEAQVSASRRLALLGSLAVLVVAVLLAMAFQSIRAALLVLFNLPLALIGGVAAIFVTEGGGFAANVAGLFGGGVYEAPVVSIASLVGFVTLFGISVRNGLLLVNHYRHLQEEEGADLREAIVRGSVERLAPILMTALTAVLGLLPLVLARGEPGSELLAPLATVVLYGLATSTLLNLVVVPAGYYAVFRGSERAA